MGTPYGLAEGTSTTPLLVELFELGIVFLVARSCTSSRAVARALGPQARRQYPDHWD